MFSYYIVVYAIHFKHPYQSPVHNMMIQVRNPTTIPPTNDPPMAPLIAGPFSSILADDVAILVHMFGDAKFTLRGHCVFKLNDCLPSVKIGSVDVNSHTCSMSMSVPAVMFPSLLEYMTVPVTSKFPAVEQLTDMLRRSTTQPQDCLLYTSPSPRDATLSRMPSSA